MCLQFNHHVSCCKQDRGTKQSGGVAWIWDGGLMGQLGDYLQLVRK